MSSTRRKRNVGSQIRIKQEVAEHEQPTVKRQKVGRSQASSLLLKVKKESGKVVRKKDVAPVTISPPGSKTDDGSLKMKFILSPKREPEDNDDEEEDDHSASKKSKKEISSKTNPSLKLKLSFKSSPDEITKGGGGASKSTDEEHVHPKKRFKTCFEESAASDLKPTSKRGKGIKLDSDSGYSDAQTGMQAKVKALDTSVAEKRNIIVDKKKDKKKKRKEKDKKKKFFKNKSDKNRFLNVHRSSDEAEDGWIEEKMKAESQSEYEVISPWSKPNEPLPEASPVEVSLTPIKLKKDKKKSKNKSKRKRGKKSKKLLHHPEKKKKDKESFTQEQIVKIQQRLMKQGLKSPSSGGDDIGELNFSSHGEDLISQLTASSGHFDPSSLLDELPVESEPLLKPVTAKVTDKKTDKNSKLKDKAKKKKKVITAYQMWCKANRASILEQTPGLDFASMSRKLGEKWHSLAEKEKTKWKHKQRALMLRHKNVPALSRMKKHVQKASNPKARSQQYKAPPPHTDPIDVAAHLKLLGDSLTNVGRSLIKQASGETEVHGSVSVLMDSMLSAIAPLLCLTSQVDELSVIPRKTQSSLLENIAYIMPGL
ncbi:putative HMG domain-containing protein 4-like [Apostichopus japonicus]|uniref:Putative HMG domain-containing protein 4-like n=1 Tax=Stichopus japonicus TaxID=307972 RepID=A0A2G8L589_STIJA|nr:putative HMG domain-containing protein 4-like [Apostichopus japonicus]